jgi:hypothetical protein
MSRFAWQFDAINEKIKSQNLAPLESVPRSMTSLMVPVPVMSLMVPVPVPVPDLHMMS